MDASQWLHSQWGKNAVSGGCLTRLLGIKGHMQLLEISIPVFWSSTDAFKLPLLSGFINVAWMLPVTHKSVQQLRQALEKTPKINKFVGSDLDLANAMV